MTDKLRIHALPLTVHFEFNTNATTSPGLSDQMKTYYSDYLIDFARPNLVHDQFGQRHPIPKGKGKTIEFRVKHQWPKMTTPLVEGVTPDGQSLSWSTLTATIAQYGGYATVSDMLDLTAIDDNILYATELCGDQAGRTLDTIVREVLNGGTNVQYADGSVSARYQLAGGEATGNHYMTVDVIRMAARFLKVMKARPMNGSYVAIIHPDVAYDLTKDPLWIDVKTYSDPQGIYNGEIGKLFNVRFVETTEAKIFHAADLTAASRNLSVKTAISSPTTTVAVNEAVTPADAAALAGRKVLIGGAQYAVASATAGGAGSASITLSISISSASAGAPIYPGEAGAKGRDVYSTLVLGADAYGITDVAGGGLQVIVKQLGSAGTADPLNQRATVGWKATLTAKRLVEENILRVETTSAFQSGEN